MSSNRNTIICIDPGASGGIAFFGNGNIHSAKMPKSIIEMNQYFEEIKKDHRNIIVFIEKVQAYGKGDDAPGKKFGINKMLANYNQILTVIQLQGFRFVEVYPITWQTTLGLKIKRPKGINDGQFKTMRKNLYKDYAQKNFPSLKVTMATSDALCLIQFVYVKMSHDMKWIKDRIQCQPSDQTSMFEK